MSIYTNTELRAPINITKVKILSLWETSNDKDSIFSLNKHLGHPTFGIWILGLCCFRWLYILYTYMDKQHSCNGRKRSRGDRIRACYRRPCFVASSLFRGIRRCVFVACFPLIHCLGCDEYRHRHHHHKHFFWAFYPSFSIIAAIFIGHFKLSKLCCIYEFHYSFIRNKKDKINKKGSLRLILAY